MVSVDVRRMFESEEYKPGEYRAVLNARGLYSSLQFVMRLSPDVHRRVTRQASVVVNVEESTAPEDLFAYATVLHETTHWWQHVGSSIGLVMSLSYPAQFHAILPYLRQLVAKIGPKKSLRLLLESDAWDEQPKDVQDLANRIVNTCFDIGFFQTLITHPQSVDKIVKDPLYECEGHSYEIAYTSIMAMLLDRVDRKFEVLPDPRGWEEGFKAVKQKKIEGYYYGTSPVVLPNVGTFQIFEGQARFSQLLYLYGAFDGKFGWDNARDHGLLKGKYVEAFELFLRLAGYDWPVSINDPIVALFLLICDLSINPGAGFPEQINSFEKFIGEVNPGKRFMALCVAVRSDQKKFQAAIKNYSRDEYIQVAGELTKIFGWTHPQQLAELTTGWLTTSDSFKSLMEYYKTFDFPKENLPPALLLSHYLAFNQDRARRPEFFCWTGAWLTSPLVTEESMELYHRHAPIFVDKEDNDGVFPRTMPGRDEKIVHETFLVFYQFIVTYDMTLQWITKPGAFKYDCHTWLFAANRTAENAKRYSDEALEAAFGVKADDFEIVCRA